MMGNGEPLVTVVILNWKRRRNIPRIVTKLHLSKVPLYIWIWNNNPDVPVEPNGILRNCNVFNSSINLRCPVRHAIALMSSTKYVLFIDDDVLPDQDLVLELVRFAERNEFSIIGVAGVRVNNEAPYTNPIYKCHSELYVIEKPTPVDYVKGRVMFLEANKLHYLWEYKPFLTVKELEEDDISVNLALQLKTGFHSYVLPGSLFENLPGWDGGLHADWNKFCQQRDATIQAFKCLGWSSLLDSHLMSTSNFPEYRRKAVSFSTS